MKESQNSLDNVDYHFPQFSKKVWILGSLSIFFFTLWINFPIAQTFYHFVEKNIKSIPGCPIHYEKMSLGFFLPKIAFDDISIPGQCFNQTGQSIELKHLNLFFRGLSFSPFGPHFKIQTQLFNNDIESYITLGFNSFALNIQDNTINLSSLNKLVPELKTTGKINLNALVKFDTENLNDLKLVLKSSNFVIPDQNIMGLALPKLAIDTLFLKANLQKKNTLKIEQFILGSETSPLRAKISGDVILNQRHLSSSLLNLQSEVFLGEDLLTNFALIKMYMDKFTKKDDYYQLNITGNFMAPRVK